MDEIPARGGPLNVRGVRHSPDAQSPTRTKDGMQG
jgi:hypothetical protein